MFFSDLNIKAWNVITIISVPVKFLKQGVNNVSEGSAKCGQPGVGSGHVRKEVRERKPVSHLSGEGSGGTPPGNFLTFNASECSLVAFGLKNKTKRKLVD